MQRYGQLHSSIFGHDIQSCMRICCVCACRVLHHVYVWITGCNRWLQVLPNLDCVTHNSRVMALCTTLQRQFAKLLADVAYMSVVKPRKFVLYSGQDLWPVWILLALMQRCAAQNCVQGCGLTWETEALLCQGCREALLKTAVSFFMATLSLKSVSGQQQVSGVR